MGSYLFRNLLQKDDWKKDVSIEVNHSGEIIAYQENASLTDQEEIKGYTLPGFQNAHSHAFQYAMAGLAEIHSPNSDSDSFWSWREAMYKLALTIDPDQMEAIATMLYSEMLRHGYTDVAEFHYLHHDKNGVPFKNLAEMGTRLVSAAKTAGINITLIPIFYQRGGFGMDPTAGQRRFISPTIDEYIKLLEASRKACQSYEGANTAVGIHSMRGVEPGDIAEIAKSGPQDIPFHIHIAEQLKEIEDSIDYLGERPVEWLLSNVELSDRFHLVHATHLTAEETEGIAKSGANVVLCPSTEGNLGDGIFPLNDYHSHGGAWSIGTDSHIGINPFEELRLLDYGQRLVSHNRKTFAGAHGDSGRFAIEMATTSGRKAMNNFSTDYFAIGSTLNACIISESALTTSSSENALLSTILYTTDSSMQYGTIVNGRMVVKNGIHQSGGEISRKFIEVMNKLGSR